MNFRSSGFRGLGSGVQGSIPSPDHFLTPSDMWGLGDARSNRSIRALQVLSTRIVNDCYVFLVSGLYSSFRA